LKLPNIRPLFTEQGDFLLPQKRKTNGKPPKPFSIQEQTICQTIIIIVSLFFVLVNTLRQNFLSLNKTTKKATYKPKDKR
jgi:hypothetical protein